MAQQIIDIGAAANDGTGEPLRDAFDAVNENFTEIYTAGPVGSNVVISGNTITVTGVNNNLVLRANGIGNVQANSSIMPSIDAVYDIGAPTARIDTVYAQFFQGNGSQLTGITTAGTSLNFGTSNVKIVSSGGNVTVSVGGTSNVLVVSSSGTSILGNVNTTNVNASANISAAGNITAGNITVSTGTVRLGNIVNTNGNAIGNIGSSGGYFNTLFAVATSAIYADLAEYYSADAEYDPGTVLSFGGNNEVTMTTAINDVRVAGVVSTNPSYTMNSGLESEHVATVALTGRVPTMVIGPVRKGDLMVAAGLGRAQSSVDPKVGSVIGKALEDFDGAEGTIEVVVGRF